MRLGTLHMFVPNRALSHFTMQELDAIESTADRMAAFIGPTSIHPMDALFDALWRYRTWGNKTTVPELIADLNASIGISMGFRLAHDEHGYLKQYNFHRRTHPQRRHNSKKRRGK